MAEKVKLFIADQRMLELMTWAIAQEDKKLPSTQGEYLDLIGAKSGNIGALKKGIRGFTNEQILAAAKLTGANLNWIYGLEKNMFREGKSKTAIDLLKEAVKAVEQELQPKKQR
jgi:hypothetical protein